MADHRLTRPLRAVALAVGLGAAALPGAAHAQFFGGWGGWDGGGTWDGLGPQQVRRVIAGRGFRVLAPLRRNGNVYVADVVDPSGQRERLIVAAADAAILQRFIVDDGRGPTQGNAGRGFAARGDGDGALVPPADIPDAGRRYVRPAPAEAPAQRFGDLGRADGDADDAPGAPPRLQPPLRTVRPRPRVVERAPEAPATGREPGAVETTPLAPVTPRPSPIAPAPSPPAAKVPAPAAASPAVASRPAQLAPTQPTPPQPTPAQAAAPAASPSTAASRRPSDPLAIPGNGDPKPVRSVASGITGAPQPAPAAPVRPAAPVKPADVPVAPLD